MPVLNPAEIWQRSGRYPIEELFKLQDRRGADLVLALTPRGGRRRRTSPGRALLPRPAVQPLPLPGQGARRAAPARRRAAHARVHHEGRLHLRPRPRGARRALRALPRGLRPDLRPDRARVVPGGVRRRDDGRRRRTRVHGAVRGGRERRRAGARLRGKRRGRHGRSQPVELPDGLPAPERVDTPGAHDRRGGRAGAARRAGLAAEGVPGDRRGSRADDGRRPRRPPCERDQARATRSARRSALRARRSSPSGSGRPATSARSASTCRSCSTTRSSPAPYITGANRENAHLRGVEPGRDFPFKRGDVRTRRGRRHGQRAPDPDRARDRGRQHLQARHALLGAARRHLPRRAGQGRSRSGWAPTASARRASPPPQSSSSPTRRASRGRGRSRRGTSISSASARPAARSARSPSGLRRAAGDRAAILYDDRDAGPGEKFADAELLGVPMRLTVGRRTLADGEVEVQVRRGREARTVPLEGAAAGGARTCGGPLP